MIPQVVVCTGCRKPYPEQGAPHCCPSCGGLFDFAEPFRFDPLLVDAVRPGLWRYQHAFGLTEDAPALSLGEGNTPLVWAHVFGRRVGFKCEFTNPTGSFKDRGMALLVSFLLTRGISEAVEDSSGNAGASFAAYAARAGMRARVFVPESASGPKRQQIGMHGADVIRVPGPRLAATEAALNAVAEGAAYASHAYLPFNLPGYATAAYEIWEQIGGEVGAVIVPVGQAGLLIGIARGFQALVAAGCLMHVPVMIGVQADACAPLVETASGESAERAEMPTVAEGVRVRVPLRKAAALAAVHHSGGRLVAAREADILPGRDELARLGFYVEPTSALVWSAMQATLPTLPDPVVAMLTGSGYKVSG